MKPAPYQVFLSRQAGLGEAPVRWERVAALLAARGHEFELVDVGFDGYDEAVNERLRSGRRDLVSAGGDGSLNALAQAVMRQPAELREQARLGAVGVGTSNDFLKPVDPDAWVAKVQVALSRRRAYSREVFALGTDQGLRHYLMNSSVGMIARGCRDFADPPWWLSLSLRVLGYPRSVALHTVVNALTHRGVRAKVTAPERLEEGTFTGITVLKTPHVASDVIFRTLRTHDDGLFDVVCLTKVSPADLPGIMEGFAREGPKDEGPVAYFRAPELELEFPEPELVEYDGEVVVSRSASYRILPDALTFLGRGLD